MFFITKLLQTNLYILPIDFKQSWWKILSQQKLQLSVAFIGEVLSGIFSPLRIILLGWIFDIGQFNYLFYLFLVWIGIYALNFFARFYSTMVQMRTVQSVSFQSHMRLLQIDPIYHSNRSSGTILSKIERGSRAYEDLLQTFFFDLVELPISIITAVITLWYYSWLLACITVIFLGVIIFLSTFVMRRLVAPLEHAFIKADDRFKSYSVENLFQVQFIRAAFASVFMRDKMHQASIDSMLGEARLSYLYNITFTIIKCVYLMSFITVCWFAMQWVNAGSMQGVVAVALVLSYMRGTYDIIRIEKPLRIVFKSILRIQDLYTYVETCGKQTYPVLPIASSADNSSTNLSVTTVRMSNLFFDYAPNAKIFNDHSLHLDNAVLPQGALYGIIGPSGIGKSTLMSMLGGQLRPTSGTVKVNGVDIYQVDDAVRQRLVALQGQIATSVRGSLRYNLFFGLPDDSIYSDAQLIEILQQVGLWSLFLAKDGLETPIGEGGLTLSGGQRQRLNFANLVLRARWYKPALILIDEPTSSLDDVSERMITDMILKLAHEAVTLVIAHRLNTLVQARGILDCSLLNSEKEMRFYTASELMECSSYYRGLISGQERWEAE